MHKPLREDRPKGERGVFSRARARGLVSGTGSQSHARPVNCRQLTRYTFSPTSHLARPAAGRQLLIGAVYSAAPSLVSSRAARGSSYTPTSSGKPSFALLYDGKRNVIPANRHEKCAARVCTCVPVASIKTRATAAARRPAGVKRADEHQSSVPISLEAARPGRAGLTAWTRNR